MSASIIAFAGAGSDPAPGVTIPASWLANAGVTIPVDSNTNDFRLFNPTPNGVGTYFGIVVNGVLVDKGPGMNAAAIAAACQAKNPATPVTPGNAIAFAEGLPIAVNQVDMLPVP